MNNVENNTMSFHDIKGYLSSRVLSQPYAVDLLSKFIYDIQVNKDCKGGGGYSALLAGPSGSGKTLAITSLLKLLSYGIGDSLQYLVVEFRFGGGVFQGVGQGYIGYGFPTLSTSLINALHRFNQENDGKDPPFIFIYVDELDKASLDIVSLLDPLIKHRELCTNNTPRFVLPKSTNLVIFYTSNHGKDTNVVNDPELSIQMIKEELVHNGMHKCDVNRLQTIIPFFQVGNDGTGLREVVQRDALASRNK